MNSIYVVYIIYYVLYIRFTTTCGVIDVGIGGNGEVGGCVREVKRGGVGGGTTTPP